MKKGMARIALTAFIAIWALFGLINPAAAQDVDSGDVEDLAGSITDKDPQQVLEAIQGDFNADHLPDGFVEAVYAGGEGTPAAGDITGAPSPTDVFDVSSFEGAIGLVPFSVTAEESDEDDGNGEDDGDSEPPAEGTLPADLPIELQSYDFYAIFFVVFEDEEAAKAALDEASDDESFAGEGLELEEHEDFGVPGASLSGAQSQEGVSTGLGLNAAQVGNVLVMGTAVQFDASGGEIDVDDIKETAKNLTAAAILHLDDSVEDL